MVTKSAKRVASFLGTSALTRPLFALGAASALLGAGQAQALDANTLPQNPNVVGGKDSFAQSGNTLNVNQSTKRTVIDWRSFDIGSKAQVNFNQPGTSAIAVNRVNSSANATQIEGGLHANGQVWILNPNGVFFGKGAHVDAAGIVASTANIDTNAFMAGSNKLQMTGADHGSVENQGNISVGANGLAAFVAPSVRNSGVINATVGKVALAAGTTYTLDLAGDHLVELGLGSVKAVVDNSGRIVNPGGTIALTAKAAGQVVSSVVNVSGVVSASSVSKSGGTITLGGDNINTTATAQLSADAGTNGNGGSITSVANNQGNYAGSFSAKGGSASGNGGSVETSGGSANIDNGIKVNTLAAHGATGKWTIDPTDLLIDSSNVGGYTSSLDSTNVDLLASNSITLNTAFDTSTQTNSNTLNFKDEDADGHLTVNLNAPITLGAHQHLIGDADVVNLVQGALLQNGINVISTAGGTVNLAAGDYAGGAKITGNDVTLNGVAGARILSLTNGVDGVEIFGNNVTVQNLEFAGPANQSFTTFAWGNDITRGIFVENGAQNFNITGNNIHGLRNDILVDGRNTGSITNNTIDNSKSGISVQYTDGTAYDKSLDSSNSPVINIAGNVQGAYGNEWGINYHLNGYWNGVAGDETHPNANPVTNGIYLANAPTLTWQQGMLAQSAANGGMSIQDQAYKTSNRTSVTVSTTGSDTHQGSVLSTLGTIQGGINAVVTGGTVNVLDGTYVIPSGGANYIEIQKALTLTGQSEAGTIIDARNASTYGVRVQADNVNLSNFTVEAPTAAGSYGIKVEPLANVLPIDPNNRLRNFSIANVTSQGSGKTELDLNGVLGATIDHFTANGAPVGNPTGSTAGNGIALTDTANVVITNSVTENNQWGGLALYQTNNTYNQQTDNITVDGTNTFNEANPIYAEDQSASQGFGALHLTGFDYVVKSPTNPNDVYTWFQRTQQNAIDFAAAVAPTTGAVEGYAGDSVNGNNTFYVGYNTANTQALSINAAVNAAASGATINVADGTYNQNVTINKANLTLQSDDGRDATTIVGQGNTALGTILVQANNFTLGGTDHGFTVVGIDNASPGIESAAVYVQGNNSGSTIQNNRITANGDEALLTEYSGTVTGLTVDNNIFDGQTFAGANPAGVGSSQQFTLANVPRQLVVISGGSGGGNTSNITFTNNQITGTTGGLNTLGQEQGNNLVTIDSHGATITGNTFAGKTDAWYDALRARGTDTTVTGNTFDGTNMGAGTNMLEINNSALVGSFTNLIANNVWNNGSAWVNHAIAGVNYVFRGIQNAITGATAGDMVNVGAGTYNEALNISKSVDIEGAGAGQTIIQPTTLLSTGVGHKYDSNVQTAVYVHDTSGVTLNGLTIDANNLGANAVVFWNNASGTISNSLIENPMAFSGAQTGQGLAVDATSGNTSDLTVSNVTFQNWNKNAIDAVTGDGSGANGGDIVLNVDHSTFTGAGDTGTIAQNGILLWEQGGGSVSATVDSSAFSDLSYNDPANATATGVLVYGSPNGSLTVSNSTFDSSVQEYISTAGGSPNEVDATQGNSFGGVAVASATNDQIFNIEDKITDGTDDTANGLVRLVDGHVYATANKDNIQNAVDVATAGDTVNVQAGTYSEQVTINKSLTLEGANAGVNAADGTGSAPATRGAETILSHNGLAAVSVNAADVTIDGFEFIGGNGRLIDWASASNIDGLTIENNIFNTPSGAVSGGIIQLAGTGTANNVEIANNLFEGTGTSALVYVGGTANAFDGLDISGNDFVASADNAVFQAGAEFDGLEVSGNYFGHNLTVGLNMGHLGDPTIEGNTFVGVQQAAMQIGTTSGGTIQNNVIDGTGSGVNSGGVLYADGIDVWGGEWGTGTSNGLVIQNNTIKNYLDTSPLGTSDRFAGIYLRPDAGPVTIQNNTIENNTIGLLANTATAGSTVMDNTFTNNTTHVLDLHGAFDLTDLAANNTLDRDVWITGGNALFGNIQTGIDVAVNGDTVNVGAGTYDEALNISKSLDIEGAGAGQTIIQPTTLLSTGVGHKYDSNVQTAVYVHDTDGVTLNGLTIDANNLGANAVVFWNNASGTISNSLIENPMAFSGAQTGQGLAVDATSGNTSDLTVSNVTFQNWNKNAIDAVTGDGSGANGGDIVLNVDHSTFTGAGDTGTIAQNGILLWEQGGGSVSATVDSSAFSDLSYNDPANATATGILVYGSPNGSLTVSNSTFDSSVQEYISTAGDPVYGYSSNEVDATQGNSFGGVAVASATNDQIFNIEDKITDGIDDTSNGLVRLVDGQVYVTVAKGDINAGIDKASIGDTVNLQTGTYTLPSTLTIGKSLSLVGAGEGATTIDGSGMTFGNAMRVEADNVSLGGFTLETSVNGFNGISVLKSSGFDGNGHPLSGQGVKNFSIANVTINEHAAGFSGLTLTGVEGAAVNHVNVDNGGSGNAIQIADSANVVLTNNTTSNADFGFVIVQNGDATSERTTGVSADTSNTFGAALAPVSIIDVSTSGPGMGALDIEGFALAIGTPQHLELHNGLQSTIDRAAALDATNSFIEGWTGTGVNNTFTVGTSTGGTALSVNTAIGAASTGGIINVNTGTYAEDVTDATQLTFNFGDVNVNSFTLASGGAGSSLNGNLTATGAIALNGASTVTGNLTAASFSSNATLAMTGNIKATGAATFNGASTITGNVTADSITDSNTLALAGNLAATHGISLGGASAIVGNLSGGSIATTAPLTLIGNATASGAVSFGGTTGVTGNVQGATIATTGPLTLVGNATASGGVTFGGVTSVTGNVKGSAITANNTLALNGSATASGAITANGAALLSGNLTGGSIALNGATTLTGNTTLDTSAANGAISTASVDGTTAGGQSLGINAGTGTVSLGDLGAATRLGAVSDASNTTLTGSTYNANSFLFGGDVTLTSADTTLNTTQSASAAGDITFQGDLFGTTDAAQSLTLIAGPGTGAASANGNITLQNAGTSAVYLNDLTVSGNDFTALTVDVGGDYNALLTGNQVFAADTLNVRGNASSIVGGDASGHIVAGGDVTIAAGGDISGTISGQNVNLTGDDVNSVVTATNAANIKGNTVEGSYTANTVTLIASNNVDAAVDATDFTLAANHGSVDGNWVTINTDGSNVVSVNGQTTVGLANVNPNQLVVEGFVLPAGTRIGANGQLILPQGVLLGLLSPGGGKPKMILVHSVQQLGELLAGGYSVIVIDLSNRDSGKPIQLASN